MGVWVGEMLYGASGGGRLRWDVGVLDKFCGPVKLIEFRWKEGVEMEEALRQIVICTKILLALYARKREIALAWQENSALEVRLSLLTLSKFPWASSLSCFTGKLGIIIFPL